MYAIRSYYARALTAADLDGHCPADGFDLIVCDASFIGLETVLPVPLTLAAPGARLVALIKPQFEVGKGRVGKAPLPVLTGAARSDGISYADCRALAAEHPLLLLFGTGWGLAPELFGRGWPVLAPIRGSGAYNHLPVRAAAAIMLDRLLGEPAG